MRGPEVMMTGSLWWENIFDKRSNPAAGLVLKSLCADRSGLPSSDLWSVKHSSCSGLEAFSVSAPSSACQAEFTLWLNTNYISFRPKLRTLKPWIYTLPWSFLLVDLRLWVERLNSGQIHCPCSIPPQNQPVVGRSVILVQTETLRWSEPLQNEFE